MKKMISSGDDATNESGLPSLRATPCSGVDTRTLAKIVEYIASTCHDCPDDSVVDICNEAFEEHRIPLRAQWGTLKSNLTGSVQILPNKADGA